ncbi:hypothetical protein SAMN05444411_10668 [Lutibacter oricola]|uniref:Pirin N-terminal domain-containing protein n=1 Tax=Lutibacter oricola TaxID=762486 RepID=A0A1H3C6F4_9FLAO|nr:pirin family protein [Lutibacter oricola]SDX49630.1 hypothetical protein SAMN05444411_10668 [Lutibacter oricola]
MILKVHKASDRGNADFGWLKANFSFSFGNYFNAERINFGALRVLNDDYIKGGMGFGTHPHNNMEIVTIPLKGSLKHKDSMSNKWIPLEVGEVQVMSAGSGIQHSEMNNNAEEELNLFQIWILPNQENLEPRYDQKAFSVSNRANKLQKLVSWIKDSDDDSLKIHQDARISRIDLSKKNNYNYVLKNKNYGVYLMLIEGEILVNNVVLNKRDALEIEQAKQFEIEAIKHSEILFIEVPM